MQPFFLSLLVTLQTDTFAVVTDNAKTHFSNKGSRRRAFARAESAPHLSSTRRFHVRSSRRRSTTEISLQSHTASANTKHRRHLQRSSSFDAEFAKQPKSSLHNVLQPRRRGSIGQCADPIKRSTLLTNASVPLRKNSLDLKDTNPATLLSSIKLSCSPKRSLHNGADKKTRADFVTGTINEALREIDAQGAE